MSEFPMFGEKNLGKSMCSRGVGFDFNGDECEHEDLEGAHCSIPHRSADAVRICEC